MEEEEIMEGDGEYKAQIFADIIWYHGATERKRRAVRSLRKEHFLRMRQLYGVMMAVALLIEIRENPAVFLERCWGLLAYLGEWWRFVGNSARPGMMYDCEEIRTKLTALEAAWAEVMAEREGLITGKQ